MLVWKSIQFSKNPLYSWVSHNYGLTKPIIVIDLIKVTFVSIVEISLLSTLALEFQCSCVLNCCHVGSEQGFSGGKGPERDDQQ